MTNGTETTVTVNTAQVSTANLSISGDPRFCHISDLFLFDTSSSFINASKPGSKLTFREILDHLRQAPPDEFMLVVGHTDKSGSASINDPLSQRRADSVQAVLEGDITVWETIYQTERSKAWGDDTFRTMLQEVTGTNPSQTEINRHKEQSSAGTQRRATLFTQYFDVLLGNPGSSISVNSLSPATLGCGEQHPSPGALNNHEPDRRAEVFFFRGNVSPLINCTEYPNWLAPCQILPPVTPAVTISSVGAIRQGQVERIQVTINPSPLPLAITVTLELNTTSGTGAAQFVSTNAATMEITQSQTVRVRAVTQSSAADNIRMTARVTGQANILAQEDFTIVSAASNPAITLSSPIVVVKKTHTNPARQSVVLGINPLSSGLVGTGTFTRSNDRIRFFTATTGGTEITFNGTDNVFTDIQLTAGVTLFSEGSRPSAVLDDVQLELTLQSTGAGSVSSPITATMTAVELTLDIGMSRTTPGVDPAPLPQPPATPPAPGATPTDKWFGGRFIHIQDAGNLRKRALIIVRQVQPAAFTGDLILRQVAISGNNITGLDTKAQLFDNEIPTAGEVAKSNPHEFTATTIPATGLQFFVEGRNLSATLRDTGFQLGIKDLEDDGDRVSLTVFKMDKIEAKLRATPCKRDGSRANVLPVKSSTKDSKTFDATAITLVRECGDLKLTAASTPAAVPVSWDVDRASDDTGLAGLPTHSKDGSDKKRILKPDATGSFHVSAFIDTNGNNNRDLGEDGLTLNVNIINIEIEAGIANNKIITRNIHFNDTRSTASTLIVDSGSTKGVVPGVNAAYGDAEFAKHPLGMKVTIKLTGGGSNQRRGTGKIGVGYIQTTPSDSVTGTYADGRTIKEIIVTNTATPNPITGGAVVLLSFPVRDTRFASVSGTGPFIISSSDSDETDIAAGGQRRVVRIVDPPAIVIPLTHPSTGSNLASISGSNDFDIFLSAFSEDFNENYTAIATASWSITYGTFSAASGWSSAGATVTASAAMTPHSPLERGEDTNVERCPPNFVDNLRMDAR